MSYVETDPIVAAMPVERPAALAQMSAEDRGRCARYFFIARGSGLDEMLAWFFTMQSSAAAVAEAREVVGNMDDQTILAIAASLPDDDEGRASFWRLGIAPWDWCHRRHSAKLDAGHASGLVGGPIDAGTTLSGARSR